MPGVVCLLDCMSNANAFPFPAHLHAAPLRTMQACVTQPCRDEQLQGLLGRPLEAGMTHAWYI